jgi:RNA polymerase sigma-70 factor, ECF subfamily
MVGRISMNSEDVADILPVLRRRSRRARKDSAPGPAAGAGPATASSSDPCEGELTDDSLLVRVGNGSREALGVLFRRHRHAVLNIGWRILKDAGEAEDLCQDVFLFLFEKARVFDRSKGTALSWLIQFTYHRAMNRRQYLLFRQHYNAFPLSEVENQVCPEGNLASEIDAGSLLNRLREELSPEQRQTLELHFFEGYSLREIATLTDQTLPATRHHYYRGVERLRSLVFPRKSV